MKLVALWQVRSQLRGGSPLPWDVRSSDGRLLLARGHLVQDEAMRAALLARGMFVDADDAARAHREAPAPPANYFERWAHLHDRLAVLLRHPAQPGFLERVRDCVAPIAALAERNADLLIFLILRHRYAHGSYGVAHSLHVAAVCGLLAQRLAWPSACRDSLVGAALTMNLSMIDLQGCLATQADPLTAAQREAIRRHPVESARLLREAGLGDAPWLAAVEQHHEKPHGGGYPASLAEPDEASQMLRWVDVFTAMHSARGNRGALPAQQVAREIYTQSEGSTVAALLIKAFGIFPPGCYVKLASGETAVVVRHGDSAARPQVAALLNRHGDPMAVPSRRDTSSPEHAIVETVPEKAVKVRVPAEAFFADELSA